MQNPHRHQQSKLFEGLRSGDLNDMVSPKFTIDQYKSKMGEDKAVIVVSFKVVDKFPAIDLMEFIEKGYPFVLDADMSAGEEKDGQYRVFIEFERNKKFPEDFDKMMRGMSQLCKCDNWRFKYYKDADSHDYNKESIEKFVPLNKEDYSIRVKHRTIDEIEQVLDQGTTEVLDVDESYNITFSKPFSGNLKAKIDAIGSYKDLSKELVGGLQLDESSNSQTLFLEKYLGNYEINKIDNKFLIRNQDKAIIISNVNW